MKKLFFSFVCVVLVFSLCVSVSAASGYLNLTYSYITYDKVDGTTGSIGWDSPERYSYYRANLIDINDSFYWVFRYDTRILPGYTYHFTYKCYCGEDTVDQNFSGFHPDSAVQLLSSDGGSSLLVYPTVRYTITNTSTTCDVFIRFEPGTDRANQVSAYNYNAYGQNWRCYGLTEGTEVPFVFFAFTSFEAVYDYDGNELDAMLAGMSDIKRGIDGVGSKLDDISGKLDDIKDDVKNGEIEAKEWERDVAQVEGDQRLDDALEQGEDIFSTDGVSRLIDSLMSVLSYQGTSVSLNMPTVKLPSFDGVIDETVLIQEQGIDFNTWLDNGVIQTCLVVVNFVSVLGIVYYFVHEIMGYVTLIAGGGSSDE